MRTCALACTALLACVSVQAKEPATASVPLDAATLTTLPRQAVEGSAHGQSLHCEGVELVALLRKSGAMPPDPLRGSAQLARYVRIDARDGYRAVYSLAELDPSLGNAKVFVVDRCDGKALDDKDGPLRLMAPAESRPARWVRQLQSIRVVDAP